MINLQAQKDGQLLQLRQLSQESTTKLSTSKTQQSKLATKKNYTHNNTLLN